nr:MAG TPA: hypothetical protein [Inoviridae sp.]
MCGNTRENLFVLEEVSKTAKSTIFDDYEEP